MMRTMKSNVNIRAAALTAVLTTLMTLAGCGAHQVILNVDVLSFTPSLQQPFTGVPDVPANAPPISGTHTVVDKQQINLLSGLGDATTIHDVSFRVQTVANATGGSGSATLRVYLSDTNTDPLTTTPILTQQLTFTAGTPDTVTSTIGGNAQLNALFAKKQLQLSIDGTFVGPTSGAALSGASLKFVLLDAVVIAGRKL
jgi:hypothetical protein